MYILSVTYVVEPTSDTHFRVYFRDEIRPMVEGREITLCRVLSERHEGHFTYSLQIPIENMSDYSVVKEAIEKGLIKYNFGESVLHLATLMKREQI
ncbi:MAG: hypothetical protein R3Y61_07875 [Rikenellaceae bacterium]